MSRSPVHAVITDLDNTLYDWFEYWYQSFRAMLDALVSESGIDEATLLPQIKAIHEKAGTSEYSYLIQSIPALQQKHPGEDLGKLYDNAVHAYRSKRKETLKLYPGVLHTLQTLRKQNIITVGYTDSLAFHTSERVRRLGLDGLLTHIYSPPDHELPEGITKEQLRQFDADFYALKKTIHRHTPPSKSKPNPEILRQIMNEIGVDPSHCIYIGDNLFKDVTMAQSAGVVDVYASYGTSHRGEEKYDLLKKVTHWPEEHVKAEREHVFPTLTLKHSFSEVLDWFNFGTPAHLGQRVEIWKTIVGVQKHFNELELRIRKFAILALGAIVSGAGLAYNTHSKIGVFWSEVPLASVLLFVGVLAWLSFWYMDRHWYHRLLLGAVRQGMKIESELGPFLPEITLTDAIKRESPHSLLGCQIRSHHRLDFFYSFIACLLLVSGIALIDLRAAILAFGTGVALFFAYLILFTEPAKS